MELQQNAGAEILLISNAFAGVISAVRYTYNTSTQANEGVKDTINFPAAGVQQSRDVHTDKQ